MKHTQPTPFVRQALILFFSLLGFSLLNLFLLRSGFRGWLESADTRLLLVICAHRLAFLTALLNVLSGFWLWGTVCLFLATFLYRHYGQRAVLLIVIALLVPVLVYAVTVGLVKPYFARLSPALRLGTIAPSGEGDLYCFVSAKAAAVVAMVTFIWLALDEQERFFKYILTAYALMVCFGRLYSGLHYPSDVLGGILLGGMLAYLAYLIFYELNDQIPLV